MPPQEGTPRLAVVASFSKKIRKKRLTPARIERTTLWTGITRSTTELRGHTRFLLVIIHEHHPCVHRPSVMILRLMSEPALSALGTQCYDLCDSSPRHQFRRGTIRASVPSVADNGPRGSLNTLPGLIHGPRGSLLGTSKPFNRTTRVRLRRKA